MAEPRVTWLLRCNQLNLTRLQSSIRLIAQKRNKNFHFSHFSNCISFLSFSRSEKRPKHSQKEEKERNPLHQIVIFFLNKFLQPKKSHAEIYIYIYILRPKKPRKEKSFWKNDVETCSAIFKTTSPDFIFVNSFFFLSLIIILLSLLFLFCYSCCLKFSRERFANNHRNETPDPRLEYYRVI